jgi:hypothetical protein
LEDSARTLTLLVIFFHIFFAGCLFSFLFDHFLSREIIDPDQELNKYSALPIIFLFIFFAYGYFNKKRMNNYIRT